MSRRLVRSVIALGLSAASAWFAAVPAGALPISWVVTNPNPNGSLTVSGTVTLRDLVTGDVLTCVSGASLGSLRSGVNSTGALGTLQGVEHACSTADGTQASALQAGPWAIRAVAYDAATARTTGTMVSGSLSAFVVSRPECQYLVSAPAPSLTVASFSHVNSTSALTASHSSLVATRVQGPGCGGIVREGNRVSYSGSYTMSPAVTIVGR